jgi:thiamine-phosphate diphosphorylase
MADFRRPILCLVTDRRRLPEPWDRSLVRLVASAARAGVTLIHVRERDLNDRDLLALTRALLDAAARTSTRVVVGDRADVAIAAGAHGVHLREDSMAADRVRGMAPRGFLIGRSVHTPAGAARAASAGVDYVVMGTIFPTASKPPGVAAAGLPALAAACQASPVPVLAIGGVTADRVGDIAAAGVAGLAAIGLFAEVLTRVVDDDDDESIETRMGELVARLRRAFAEGKHAP